MRIIKHRKVLSVAALHPPPSEILKIQLDRALSNPVYAQWWPCSEQAVGLLLKSLPTPGALEF